MERVRRVRAEISHHDSAQRFRTWASTSTLGAGHFSSTYDLRRGRPDHRIQQGRHRHRRRPGPHPDSRPGRDRLHHQYHPVSADRAAEAAGRSSGRGRLAQRWRRPSPASARRSLSVRYPADHGRAAQIPICWRLITKTFIREGIDLRLESKIQQVARAEGPSASPLSYLGETETLEVDEILLAAGRSPTSTG